MTHEQSHTEPDALETHYSQHVSCLASSSPNLGQRVLASCSLGMHQNAEILCCQSKPKQNVLLLEVSFPSAKHWLVKEDIIS